MYSQGLGIRFWTSLEATDTATIVNSAKSSVLCVRMTAKKKKKNKTKLLPLLIWTADGSFNTLTIQGADDKIVFYYIEQWEVHQLPSQKVFF